MEVSTALDRQLRRSDCELSLNSSQQMKPPQRVIMPAIDPFTIKNRQLRDRELNGRLDALRRFRSIYRSWSRFRASIRGKIPKE